MNQRLQWFVGLFLLAVGSGWLLYYFNEQEADDGAVLQESPAAYMEDFLLTVLGPDGTVLHEISGQRMEHFSSDDSTQISAPSLVLYGKDGSNWRLESEQGWAAADNTVVLLIGNVRVWREGPDGEQDLELLTSNLRLQPRDSYAETSEPAVLRTSFGVTRAVGMQAWFDEERMKFLSGVRGRYEIAN